MDILPFVQRAGSLGARALGLTTPLGLGVNAALSSPMIYNQVKDDQGSAERRASHGSAMRRAMREHFNDERVRQGVPELIPDPQAAIVLPQAPQVAQVPPPFPPSISVPSLPQPPASLLAAPAAPPEEVSAQSVVPQQPVSGPDLIRKFMEQLHGAPSASNNGTGVHPDIGALRGW